MQEVSGLIPLALAGSIVVAVAAQINVPMIPVHMTLQTFAVLVIGMAYGARLGAATLLLYMLEGVAGLPVFAGVKKVYLQASSVHPASSHIKGL